MTDINPYLAPSADLSGSPVTKDWPGLSRRWYWLGALAVTILPALVGVALMDGTEQSGNEGLLLVIQLVSLFGFMLIAVRRLRNIGDSGWWVFGLLVPLLNVYVGIRCAALPAGYAEHRKMDLAAKLMIGLVVGIFVLGIVAAIALPAYQDYVQRAAGA